jgi:hypothetical protein
MRAADQVTSFPSSISWLELIQPLLHPVGSFGYTLHHANDAMSLPDSIGWEELLVHRVLSETTDRLFDEMIGLIARFIDNELVCVVLSLSLPLLPSLLPSPWTNPSASL